MRAFVLMAIALMLLLPSSHAHAEYAPVTRTMHVDGYLAVLEIEPAPLVTNMTPRVELFIMDTRTDARVDAQATLRTVSPSGEERHATLEPQRGILVGSIALAEAGTYRLDLDFDVADVTRTASTEFPVYVRLPFKIWPSDVERDLQLRVPEHVEFRVTDILSGLAVDPLDDLRARIVAPSGAASEHALERGGEGIWLLTHAFTEAGDHVVEFSSASGRIGFADVPPLVMHVQAERTVPFPVGILLVAAAGAPVALRRLIQP